METRDLPESASTPIRASDPRPLTVLYDFRKNRGISPYEWSKEDHCLQVPNTLTIGSLRKHLLERFLVHEEFLLPPGTVCVPIRLFQKVDESNDAKLLIDALQETVPDAFDSEHPTIFIQPEFAYTIEVAVIENPAHKVEEAYDANLDESVAKPGTIVKVDNILQSEIRNKEWIQKILQAVGVGLSQPHCAHLLWKGEEIKALPFVREWSKSRLEIWINQWLLCVRTLEGETIRVSVNPQDNPKALMDAVKRTKYVDDISLLNSAHGTVIPDNANRSLQSLGVRHDSVLYLIPVPPKASSERRTGCTIPKAEHRGMTIEQLQELGMIVLTRCVPEEWTSTNPGHDNKLLRPEEVTLYDLMHHYVKPETQARNCSYVELVSNSEEAQIPLYFSSHWWGEPVLNFVALLSRHARNCWKRHPGVTPVYWICGYALRQHDLAQELPPTTNLLDTPFFRAMKSSRGTVSILDTEAVTYKRIWCVFELYISLEDMKAQSAAYTYDICAMSKDDTGPVVLMDPTDKNSGAASSTSFPFDTCLKALAVNLGKAEASYQRDRDMILHHIVGEHGRSSDGTLKSDESLSILNRKLQGMFAQSLYPVAVSKGNSSLPALRSALRAAPYTDLNMSFRGGAFRFKGDAFRDEAKNFVGALPQSLESLSLDFNGIWFEDSSEFASGLRRLQSLTALELRLGENQRLVDANALWFEVVSLHSLESLKLDFHKCGDLKQIKGLGEALPSLQRLSYISLDLSETGVESFGDLWEHLAAAESVTRCSFKITLSGSTYGIASSLADGISKLSGLDECEVILNGYSEALFDIGKSLAGTSRVPTLRVRTAKTAPKFDGIPLPKIRVGLEGLKVLEWVGDGIMSLPNALASATGLSTLCLKNNTPVDGVYSGLAESIVQMCQLEELTLYLCDVDLSYCVHELCNAFSSACLERLTKLHVHMSSEFDASRTNFGPGIMFLNDLTIFSGQRMPVVQSLRLVFNVTSCYHDWDYDWNKELFSSVAGLADGLRELKDSLVDLEVRLKDFVVKDDSMARVLESVAGAIDGATMLDLELGNFPRIQSIEELRNVLGRIDNKSLP